MAYDEKSLAAAGDKSFEPAGRIEIEMICRFVEQQYLGAVNELAG